MRVKCFASLALVLALALPVSATAAPLGELPFARVPHGVACMAPTGAPGELSRWAGSGAEVLTAGVGGLGRASPVPLGPLPGCPRAAAAASGAAVVAGATKHALRVALREPGSLGPRRGGATDREAQALGDRPASPIAVVVRSGSVTPDPAFARWPA